MSTVAARTPFETLQRLEWLGEQHRAELPAQEDARHTWSGIGFRIGGRRFVAPMGEVTEILTIPQVSRVPRAKSWVWGVANVRGNLLPIMDLSQYLGKGGVNATRLTRVMVIEQGSVAAGLLVDEVLGMRHFFSEERSQAPAQEDDSVQPYVDGVFRRDGSDWTIFSMAALAGHPQFLKVAE
ncbi:MAG: chemotaxis protein CheW [Ectothiorhodospiraceae bacterium]|jgi:twitching motility protein PilI